MYRLRELDQKDLEIINTWHNNPELIACLGAPFRYINYEDDKEWLENYLCNRNNTLRCAIVEKEYGEILGLVSLTSIDYVNQSAEVHIIVGEENNCGKGIGTFAVNNILYHAFYNMDLHRIELTVLESNNRVKHFYEKCGFVCEGRERHSFYENERFVDTLRYSILKEEFFPIEGGETVDLSADCFAAVSGRHSINKVVCICDRAFEKCISQREEYQNLLTKMTSSATVIYAYGSEHPSEGCKVCIKGFVSFYANDFKSKRGYISFIAVLPEFQNCHIGKGLLKECELICRSREMKQLALEVRKDNINGICFYERNGFIREAEKEKSFILVKQI